MANGSAPKGPQDSSAGRFSWQDSDCKYYDEDGAEMTIRQVKEAQLERCRSQVAEDVEADTGAKASD